MSVRSPMTSRQGDDNVINIHVDRIKDSTSPKVVVSRIDAGKQGKAACFCIRASLLLLLPLLFFFSLSIRSMQECVYVQVCAFSSFAFGTSYFYIASAWLPESKVSSSNRKDQTPYPPLLPPPARVQEPPLLRRRHHHLHQQR